MTIFKTFFKVGRKYIGNIFMYSGIFLSIVLVIASVNGNTTTEEFMASEVKVAVFDHDNSDLSKGMVQYLEENHNLLEIEEDLNTIRDRLYQRRVEYVIIIPEGFGESFAGEGEKLSLDVYKLPGTMTSQFMDMALDTFLSTYRGYLAAGMELSEAYAKTVNTIAVQTDVAFYSGKEAPVYAPIHFFYMYVPYALISVVVLAIGPILIVFNNGQIKSRINCSRVSAFRKNMSLMAGSGIYTVLIVLIYFVISLVLYKSDVFNTAGIFRVLNMLIYAFVCLAFAFLLSLLTSKSHLLNIFTNVFGLGSSFLCGVFVPRMWLSDGVVAIGRFLPAYWYVNVEEALCSGEVAASSVIATGYLVQILYGVAVFVIALVLSQYKRKG